jgi:hypothetical protein
VLVGVKVDGTLKLLAFLMSVALLSGCAGNAADAPRDAKKTPISLPQLPFRGALPVAATDRQIAAGTPIPIRMRSSISSATASPGDHFSAILDEDLEVEGKIIAPKGTPVTGRVLAARRSGRLHAPGYMRITLASIKLNGQQVHLQTSSIFLQGPSYDQRNLMLVANRSGSSYVSGRGEADLGIKRRLTFRLVQALVVKF